MIQHALPRLRALPKRLLRWLYTVAFPCSLRRPFYAIPLIVLSVVLVRLVLGTMSETTKEQADPYLIFGIGLIYTACMLACLIYTSSWAIRSSGVLLTLAGDAVLYTSQGGAKFWTIDPATLLNLINWARSCFYVGGPLLLIGLVIWVFTQSRTRHRGEPL